VRQAGADLAAGRWGPVLDQRQVLYPVAGPAQLWAAPLGADPADLSQWVHLGEAGQVAWADPAAGVLADLQAAQRQAELAGRGLWQVAHPVVDLDQQVESLRQAVGSLGLAELGRRWVEQLEQVMAALVPEAPLEPHLAVEADPALADLEGMARAGLAGVMVPRSGPGSAADPGAAHLARVAQVLADQEELGRPAEADQEQAGLADLEEAAGRQAAAHPGLDPGQREAYCRYLVAARLEEEAHLGELARPVVPVPLAEQAPGLAAWRHSLPGLAVLEPGGLIRLTGL
jgi:hypothetical protein